MADKEPPMTESIIELDVHGMTLYQAKVVIETTENDHGYSVAADETLLASCTIQITGMMAVIAQAAEYAR